MKILKKIVPILLVVSLCFSLAACGIVDSVKNIAYNSDEELKEGYTEITSMKGVKFAVPTDLDKADGTEEEILGVLMAIAFGAKDELPEGTLEKNYKISDETQYSVMNFSKIILGVAQSDLKIDLSKIEDANALNVSIQSSEDMEGMTITNKEWSKISINGETKIIVSVDADMDTMGKYTGKITMVQNKNGDIVVGMCLFLEGTEADNEMANYFLKSIELTGEAFATGEDADNDAEDDTSIEIDTEEDFDIEINLSEEIDMF